MHADTIITSEEDITRLLRDFSLIGGGGTDFRPAFTYVNHLLEEGIFHDLRGLLYFTDGKGIYPAKRPPYETAFVFLEKPENTEGIPEVPVWAMRIQLEEDDLSSHL